MTDNVIQFPIKITPLKEHMLIKEHILAAIAEQPETEHMKGPNNDITNCDWGPMRFDRSREWLSLIGIDLHDHLGAWCNTLGYYDFHINEIWFQQYQQGSKHSWHVHGSNFTNVYYLDMPKDSPKTQFVDPKTQYAYEFDVEEGDIISFPSWLIHRAPPNESKEMKTIISWNMDVILTDHYESINTA